MPKLFDASALDTAVHTVLESSDVPAGHMNVIVGTVDSSGAALVIGLKRDVNGISWQLQGLYRHDWTTHEDQVAGRVIASW